MRLVYLYIEKYKSIIDKGFNFSSQFKCEYKDEVLGIEEMVVVQRFPNYLDKLSQVQTIIML